MPIGKLAVEKMLLQLTFNPQALENAFNFLQSGACSWMLGPGMICGIRNFALPNARAVPNANANASVVCTSDNLDVYRVVGRRPPGLELLRKRSRIYFGLQIGGTSVPRARVSAVGTVRHTGTLSPSQR
jgi:hypothetical protein